MTGEPPLRRLALDARAVLLWVVSGLHFALGCGVLFVLRLFVDAPRSDWFLRRFCRNVVRLAGARFRVVRPPGYDGERTVLFVSNHVNVFDAFVVYSAVPQFTRGLHLEAHFRVPFYGWLMKRFENVGVPAERSPAAVRAMVERCRRALEGGTSLVMFPEGHRTRTGRVGSFHLGTFRMAKEFRVPLVPMSIVGSFAWKRPKSWRLRPARVVVHLHDAIEPEELRRLPEGELRDRVREIVRRPVES
jgi:1-acyl-sn-glycerol-3-phosphate acyltransferase